MRLTVLGVGVISIAACKEPLKKLPAPALSDPQPFPQPAPTPPTPPTPDECLGEVPAKIAALATAHPRAVWTIEISTREPRKREAIRGRDAAAIVEHLMDRRSWGCGVYACKSAGTDLRLIADEGTSTRTTLALWYSCGNLWSPDGADLVAAFQEDAAKWFTDLCHARNLDCL
ncbi:MAG: hypothetical protein K8W52_36825 [Deltaproteobacteria bacterium]|nr:hypothetical protein [Deltaproteobacteria bacterium]